MVLEATRDGLHPGGRQGGADGVASKPGELLAVVDESDRPVPIYDLAIHGLYAQGNRHLVVSALA